MANQRPKNLKDLFVRAEMKPPPQQQLYEGRTDVEDLAAKRVYIIKEVCILLAQ